MKEFVDKLIGRLEEIYNRNDKAKKEAYEEQDWEYFDLFTHRNDGVYTSISIVNKLAEEYNNGWIPCTEKLPEDDDEVLCWYEYRRMKGTHEGEMNQAYEIGWYSKVFEMWCGEVSNGHDCKVIAWMPLPQPFKAGD